MRRSDDNELVRCHGVLRCLGGGVWVLDVCVGGGWVGFGRGVCVVLA